MAYRPNYSVTDVKIPEFLSQVRDIDFLGGMNRFQKSEKNTMALDQLRREEEAKQAIRDLELGGDPSDRNRQIEDILLRSGDLDSLGKMRESSAKTNANDMLAEARRASGAVSAQELGQEVIDQLGFGLEGLQTRPEQKVSAVGGSMVRQDNYGNFENLGPTRTHNKPGGSGSGGKGKREGMARIVGDDREIFLAENDQDYGEARAAGFLPEKYVPKEMNKFDNYNPKVVDKGAWATSKTRGGTDAKKWNDMKANERKILADEYKAKGGKKGGFQDFLRETGR